MKKTILMAVGSSGGHIYPAFAVSEQLKELSKDLDIHFVHSGSNFAATLMEGSPYPVHRISIGGGLASGGSLFRKIKTLFQLPWALLQSLLLIRRLKVHAILGTGGAVTVPVLIAGFLMRKRRAIWEGNAEMGLANRFLAFFVPCIFRVFPKSGSWQKKQKRLSYPLRSSFLLSQKDREEGEFEESKREFRVLILGGSQGSVFLNQVVLEALKEETWRQDIFFYHQTGKRSFDEVQKKYQSLKGVEFFSFSKNIEKYYQKADLIFSRAGSGAIWELAFYEKALVLVPLTYSAGGHQLKNARALSLKHCVELIEEKDFHPASFKSKIRELKENRERRRGLALSLKKASQGEGASSIASWLLEDE